MSKKRADYSDMIFDGKTTPGGLRSAIAAGMDLDARDVAGNAPLALAIRAKRPDLVAVLLEAKADPNVQNNNGNTPLMEAVLIHEFVSTGLLLQHGADPDLQRPKSGDTALMMTGLSCDRKSIVLLIEAGANIYLQDGFNADAMMHAHREGNKSIAAFIRDTAKGREERLAAEKREREFRENMKGIASNMEGGLSQGLKVTRPLQFTKGPVHG